ncbi:tyrosine-type recombinase/integrase [Halorarius halobius]|uniref:tyrosine-type recombinase/integrase n=1 Tax=Halorarius halobius TaxID=2962671 RepID=UPI0020CF0D2F|nr:site-specific integrase [Halorarius halobius]
MPDTLQPLSPEDGVDRFLAMRRDSGNRDTTYQNDVTRMNHFLDWCEEEEIENLNNLTGRQLSDFVSWRCEQVAKSTVEKQISSVREALRFWANIEAVEQGLAERIYAPQLRDVENTRGVHLEPQRAERILGSLDRFHYASRRHVVMALLWRTGMRRSALRSIDVDDLKEEDHAVRLEHRLDEGTRLKNGDAGSRWVFLGPRWFQIVKDYLDNPDRPEVTDDHGRRPLITTEYGRPGGDTIYKWVNKATHPCEYGECPHDREPSNCEARGTDGYPSKCPSARSPHAVRRGAITQHLNEGTSPEVVSERMDVGLDTLYKHYDARNERQKMEVRKGDLPE